MTASRHLGHVDNGAVQRGLAVVVARLLAHVPV